MGSMLLRWICCILGGGSGGPDLSYTYSGYYSYDVYKVPIQIFSSNEKCDDSLNIRAGTEHFKGYFDGKTFSGVWYVREKSATYEEGEGKKLKEMPFELSMDSTDKLHVRYDVYCDSLKLKPQLEDVASLTYAYLFSNDGTDKELDSLLIPFYGSSSYPDMKEKMQEEKNQLFKGYKEEATFNLKYPKGDHYRYCSDYTVNVIYNDSNILSIEFTNAGYQGGMKEYVFSQYHTYSFKDKRWVQLSDIINIGDTITIKMLSTMHLMKDGWDKSPIGEFLSAYQNEFYVTPKGIMILYPKVMPVLAGPAVFIPFTEFGDKLKKQNWMELN